MKMVLIMGVVFIWGSHPLSMMMGLVFLVLYLFMYLYTKMLNFWLGYLLVLVMLSGVLVVFSYMLSLIPNFSFENFSFLMPFLGVMLIFSVFESSNFLDTTLSSVCLWMMDIGFITMYLVGLLLLLMVVVLFLSIMDWGSLRVGWLYAW